MPVNTADLLPGGGPNAPQGLINAGGRISIATVASGAGMGIGELRLVFNASGCSMAYSSGVSMYFFGGSTISAVQS
jgi:hypothetical protein